MGDWVFAFFHLFLLIGIVAYALYALIQGKTLRFGLIVVCLIVYYFLVLHKPVKTEIKRRREEQKNKETPT
jgi:Ca2+/Na+ antiporter